MTIIRVGATKQYSTGWEAAFSKGKKKAEPAVAVAKTSAKSKKTSAKKTVTKKTVAPASAKKKSGGKKAKKK